MMDFLLLLESSLQYLINNSLWQFHHFNIPFSDQVVNILSRYLNTFVEEIVPDVFLLAAFWFLGAEELGKRILDKD